ncbi:MAG TPA: penicillin acylase family protein, partial [Kofleriaceae bacterium]|nr:penicillin acylase family protein [Kofleriaceae bacterium]
NLASDIYMAVLNAEGRVAATWASQPEEIRDLVRGYAHGVNRYLHDAQTLPEACRGQPWVREITELDLMRVLRRFAIEASGAEFIEEMAAAQPPSASSARLRMGVARPTDVELLSRYRVSLGSNGVAFGGEVTASGAGLLLATPHFPWQGPYRFYEAQLTIAGKVDVFGGTLSGLPIIGIGHNAHVAWTHTVNSSRHFAFYQLQLDPKDSTRYVVDGESRAMTATDVEVRVRAPGGGAATERHRVWSTELGPLVAIPGFLEWSERTAYAFGDANVENTRLLQAWWGMNCARSLDELRAAVEGTLGIPWVNTVAVDAAGTAYLGDVTPVPNLPQDRCIAQGFEPLAARGLAVLDGSTVQCRWVVAAGTPTPGIVPAQGLPSITRRDFVQNSNDSAWLSNPAAPLVGYPAIVSRDGEPASPRTRLGLAQIAAELAAGRRFTPRSALDLAFSNRAFHATTLLDDLRALCGLGGDARIVRGCAVLAQWDGTAELASVGWPMFRAWRTALDEAASRDGLSYWTVAFDPVDPVATPRGLRIDDPAVALAAREALVAATATLDEVGLDPARPWGELQGVPDGVRRIAIHGGGGDHFNDGGDEMYNTINSRRIDGQLVPFYGSSLILAISFEGGVPTAQGLLTYSQSADPASPHHSDQTERFSRKEWITYPTTPAAIARDPALVATRIDE